MNPSDANDDELNEMVERIFHECERRTKVTVEFNNLPQSGLDAILRSLAVQVLTTVFSLERTPGANSMLAFTQGSISHANLDSEGMPMGLAVVPVTIITLVGAKASLVDLTKLRNLIDSCLAERS